MTDTIEGADPTAPGGMSEAALAEELMVEYGWAREEVDLLSWPEKIDMVVRSRADTDDEDDEDDEDTDPMMMDGAAEAMQELAEVGSGEGAFDPAPSPLFIGMPDSKDYIFDNHRGAGPSGAERWMACTASLGASRAFLETLTPNQQAQFASGSTAARQGTTAHAVAEVQANVMLGKVSPEEADTVLLELAVMPEDGAEAYDDTMEEYVSEYVDLVKSYVDEGRTVVIEERVVATIPLLTYTDGEADLHDIAGSVDLGVIPEPDHPVLVVGDLKYGEGIDVGVEENPQIRIYALGLLADVVEFYDGLPEWLTEVEYIIAQPRLGGIKSWTESIDDLLDWQDTVLSKALTEALGGIKAGAAFNPGPVQCQWCPARGSCPALIEERMEKAADLFDVITDAEFADGPGAFPETASLTSDRLAELYTQITGLTKIAAEMKEELQRRLFRGTPVPGYLLVNYSPPRKWTEQAIEELDPGNKGEGILSEDQAAALWQHKLVTPTAAEKILGGDYERIADLVDKPDKRPVIAPEGDRRKAWDGLPPEAMFDVEED
jgi:hypothetical protein